MLKTQITTGTENISFGVADTLTGIQLDNPYPSSQKQKVPVERLVNF